MNYLDNFFHQITGNPNGHKLVFLHGVMGSAANWLRVIPAFQSEFHILSYDQRGHGRSFHPQTGGPDGGYHPRDYAGDLRHILDELGWEQVVLVGHSMGARNALEFADHFSQRVKVLVLEDIGPDANYPAIDRINRLLSLVPTPFATREQARDFFENQYPEQIAFYPDPEVVSKFLLTNIVKKDDGRWDWRFAKEAILQSLREGRNEDRWDVYRNLKMPVLVVRGEKSQDLSRPVFERMMKELPSARAVEVAGAGHWIHFDQTEAFIRVLKDFFHATLGTNL
jgi:esterase